MQAILFSHPGDFTPVCTTELGEVARRADDFAKRNVKVIGISANGLEDHNRWIADINEFGAKVGPTDVKFPIVSSDLLELRRSILMSFTPTLDRRCRQEDFDPVRHVGWTGCHKPRCQRPSLYCESITAKVVNFTSWTVSLSQVRTVFVIDPKKTIRLTLAYPASTGRNFDEIIR